MAIDRIVVRKGTFFDSVALMLASQEAAGIEGIEEASILNATPLNVELLERQGFAPSGADDDLGPNDLVIALRAESDSDLDRAVTTIEAGLQRKREPRAGATDQAPPRSITAAAQARGGINVAVISVPGQHATYEAARALDSGLDVFCFSSGPSIEAELALKRQAADRDLLMMGPDCGTTILSGVSLGFGNAVADGPVGIVGASGTGIQAIACSLDASGVGISHAIGVGGRDLKGTVGGLMALRGIELLAGDPGTEVIVVVAKSPDPSVAKQVVEAAQASGKGAVFAFPGMESNELSGELTASLGDAADAAALKVGAEPTGPSHRGELRPVNGAIRGLFSGGTLRDEAAAVISSTVGDVSDQLPADPPERHAMVDLGDERYTEGRAHPMIDPTLRISMLKDQGADPAVGVLLLDVVLGYGAHPDPATAIAPAIEAALSGRGDSLNVVVFLCGTKGDHQGLEAQADRLLEAGAVVTRSNAHAARLALEGAGLGEERS